VPPGCAPKDVGICGHAYVLIPCDREHSDEEGCEGERETTTAGTQNSSAPIDQSSANVIASGLTPREIATRIQARFGRSRGFAAWQQKWLP